MAVYIILTLLTVGLGMFINNRCPAPQYGYSKQQVLNVVCILSVFLLLFMVSALRMNVGNDYAKYCEYYHLIRCRLDTDSAIVPTEPGFNLVVIILYFLSGRQENYFVMFAFFAFFTLLYFMLGMYKQSDSFPMTLMMFMCLGFYFQSFSTVRYYFALAIAFYSIKYVLNREWLKFVIAIGLTAFFHKSVVLVIPMYFLALWSWKKWQGICLILASSTLIIFKDIYTAIFLKFYPTYENTGLINGGTSTVSILRCCAVLVLGLVFYKSQIKDNEKLRFYFNCNIGALIVYLGGGFLPDVSRAAYYLSITHIIFVPSLIVGIKSPKWRRLFTIALVLACVIYFAIFIFYEAPRDGLRILPYQTWIYHDMVNILSDMQ